MKIRYEKIAAVMMAAALSISLLGGCAGKEAPDKAKGNTESVGKFKTKDIDGNICTEKIFEDAELTVVNVFATWCTPCVQELPDLQKLSEQMADKGVKVVGVVMDTVDENGDSSEEGIEKAKMLQKQAEITYPLIIPDSGYMNGRLSDMQSYPETFFVDKNGNIVGKTYGGSAGLEEWTEVVEKELAALEGETK